MNRELYGKIAEDDQIQNILFRLSVFCCTGIALATIYDNPELASTLFHVSFFINFVAFINCLHTKLETKNLRIMVYIFLFIFIFGIVSIISVNINFEYMKKFIIYVTVLSNYFIATTIRPSRRTVFTLLSCNALLAVFYIIRSQVPGAYVGKTLWLYFSNPNFTGMWLSMTAMLLVVTIAFFKNKILKLAVIFLAVYVMYLCYETGARNVILAIFYMSSLLLYCIISRKKQFPRITLLFLDIFPLLFAVSYVVILKYVGFSTWIVERFATEGKTMTSRYAIWLYAIAYIREHIMFGAYRLINGGTGSFQLHNTHLDTWASYGTVGFFLFYIYLYKIMQTVNSKSKTIRPMLALSGFVVMLFIGTGEAGLYANGMGMYIYVASFLMMANYFAKNDEERKAKIESNVSEEAV